MRGALGSPNRSGGGGLSGMSPFNTTDTNVSSLMVPVSCLVTRYTTNSTHARNTAAPPRVRSNRIRVARRFFGGVGGAFSAMGQSFWAGSIGGLQVRLP